MCVEGMHGFFTLTDFVLHVYHEKNALFHARGIMTNASKAMLDSSLPRHLFCMQYFNFVNSLACTRGSIWGRIPS